MTGSLLALLLALPPPSPHADLLPAPGLVPSAPGGSRSAPGVAPPPPQTDLAPELVDAPNIASPARILAGLGAGVATLAGGTLTGYALGSAVEGGYQGYGQLFGALFGLALAGTIYPLSVAGGSRAVDGQGSIAGAYMGALAGYTAAAGLFALTLAPNDPPDGWVIVTGLTAGSVVALAGPIVGSEMVVRKRLRSERRVRALSPRVIPVVARNGRTTAAWGLGGRF